MLKIIIFGLLLATVSQAAASGRPKILCLHGGGETAVSFQANPGMRDLEHLLNQYEFVYVTAGYPDGDGALWVGDPSGGKHNPANDPLFAVKSVNILNQKVHDEGPFYGILGYSQGAAFIPYYLAQVPLGTFQVAIMFCGFVMVNHVELMKLVDRKKPFGHIPAFIYMGERDDVVPNIWTQNQAALFQSPTIISDPEGGHQLPSSANLLFSEILQFFADHPDKISRAQYLVNGIYTIQQKQTQRYLDAYQEGIYDYAAVLRTSQSDNSQYWKVTAVNTGVYKIQQMSTKRYLDAYDIELKDHAAVTRPNERHGSQLWKLIKVSTGVFKMQQVETGRYLDAYEDAVNDYAVVTRLNQDDTSQQWRFQRQGSHKMNPEIQPQCSCPLEKRGVMMNPMRFGCKNGYKLVSATTDHECSNRSVIKCPGPGWVCQNHNGHTMAPIEALSKSHSGKKVLFKKEIVHTELQTSSERGEFSSYKSFVFGLLFVFFFCILHFQHKNIDADKKALLIPIDV